MRRIVSGQVVDVTISADGTNIEISGPREAVAKRIQAVRVMYELIEQELSKALSPMVRLSISKDEALP